MHIFRRASAMLRARHRHRRRRRHHCRCRTNQRLAYTALSIQSEDEELDTMGLLGTLDNFEKSRGKQRTRLRYLMLTLSNTVRRRTKNSGDIQQSLTMDTCATHLNLTPEKNLPARSSMKDGEKLYSIISDIDSTSMRREQTNSMAPSFSEVWNDEEEPALEEENKPKPKSGKRRLLRRVSLCRCFAKPAREREEHIKDMETIPLEEGEDDALSSLVVSTISISSMSTDMPPPVTTPSVYLRTPVRRASGIVPGDAKILEGDDSTRHSRAELKDGECVSLASFIANSHVVFDECDSLEEWDRFSRRSKSRSSSVKCAQFMIPPPFPPPRCPESFHGSRVSSQACSTLGIESAHPNWNGTADAWEEEGDDSISDDESEDSSVLPIPSEDSWSGQTLGTRKHSNTENSILDDEALSFERDQPPIHFQEWTKDAWMHEPFSPHRSTETSSNFVPLYPQKANTSRYGACQEPEVPPAKWTKESFLRFAKDLVAPCGQLGSVVFDEMPYDEMQDIIHQKPCTEDTVPRSCQTKIRPLRPNPKDSLSYSAWVHKLRLPRTSLWPDSFHV